MDQNTVQRFGDTLREAQQAALSLQWDEVCDALPWLIEVWEKQGKAAEEGQQIAQLMGTVLSLADTESRRTVSRYWKRMGAYGAATLERILLDGDGDFHGRWMAGRSLGELGASGMDEARDTVLRLMGQQQDDDTLAILSGAITVMGAAAIETLGSLLASPETRPAAVQSLVKICHPGIVTPLATVLEDPDPQLRALALEAIGNFQDPRSMSLLLSSLKDPASAVRREAVLGLGRKAKAMLKEEAQGTQSEEENGSGDRPTDEPADDDQSMMGRTEIEAVLVESLRDFSLVVCEQAAISLGRLQTPTAVVALHETLKKETTPVPLRRNIVQALIWSDSDEALDCLAVYLHETIQNLASEPQLSQRLNPTQGTTEAETTEKPEASSIVFSGFENQELLTQQETVKDIIQMLGRVSGDERRSQASKIIQAWWSTLFEDPHNLAQLLPGRRLPVPLREAIAQTLGQLRNPDSQGILEILLQDTTPSVRYRAEPALRFIRPKSSYLFQSKTTSLKAMHFPK
ncbi:MAG: HEAT repeat domain-containing protein [Cyanobacteria bacterium P01_D01_bin.73]